jgi:hypothetical protein
MSGAHDYRICCEVASRRSDGGMQISPLPRTPYRLEASDNEHVPEPSAPCCRSVSGLCWLGSNVREEKDLLRRK